MNGFDAAVGGVQIGKARRGFTLIELLVVVAIIALLIAILLPSLGKAKMVARGTACAANLHSLAIANTSYTVVNDGLVCNANAITPVAGGPSFSWIYESSGSNFYYENGLFYAFLQNVKVLQCPEAVAGNYPVPPSSPPTQWFYPGATTGTSISLPVHYGMALISPTPPLSKMVQMTDPQETVVMGDSLTVSNSTGLPGYSISVRRPSSDTTVGSFAGRHMSGRGNVAFYDAHVEPVLSQLHPITASLTTTTTVAYSAAQGYHIGSLCYGTMDNSQASSWTNLVHCHTTILG